MNSEVTAMAQIDKREDLHAIVVHFMTTLPLRDPTMNSNLNFPLLFG